jgi:biopolymer transport protein ExbB/TolQ
MVLIELAIGLAAATAAVFTVRRLTRKNSSGHLQCPEKEKH